MEADVAKYFYELGQLKRVKRSGWWLAGLRDPESVAEHAFRTAAIAYVLAAMEGANPEKAAALALFSPSFSPRLAAFRHRFELSLHALARAPRAFSPRPRASWSFAILK